MEICWALTWQNETEGGWLEEEDHAFAERHGDTDGAHHHHGETQQGQDSCCQIQICEEEQKQHLDTECEKKTVKKNKKGTTKFDSRVILLRFHIFCLRTVLTEQTVMSLVPFFILAWQKTDFYWLYFYN